MRGRLHHLIVDCPDPAALARFYAALLGQPVTYESDDFVVVSENDLANGDDDAIEDALTSAWRLQTEND